MADITQLPIMTARDAESIGFARFNDVPTMPIDIPDGNFTISARTSDGRRITFFFGEYKRGAAPSFIDIQYHDNGTTIPNANGGTSPSFDLFTIGRGGRNAYDSRHHPSEEKPSIAVILLGSSQGATKFSVSPSASNSGPGLMPRPCFHADRTPGGKGEEEWWAAMVLIQSGVPPCLFLCSRSHIPTSLKLPRPRVFSTSPPGCLTCSDAATLFAARTSNA